MCEHETTKEISTRCFAGPVTHGQYRPAAHGNVEITEECVSCGARRPVNVNGRHREEGNWSASRARRREQAAERLRLVLQSAPGPAIVRSGDATVEVTVDAEGYLCLRALEGTYRETDEAAIVRASGLLAFAKRLQMTRYVLAHV